jgi:hypothetical protein
MNVRELRKLIKEEISKIINEGNTSDLIVWTPGYEMEQLKELFGTFLKVKKPYYIEDDENLASKMAKHYVVDLNINKLKELLKSNEGYTIDDTSGYFEVLKDGGRELISFEIGKDPGEISDSILKSLNNQD